MHYAARSLRRAHQALEVAFVELAQLDHDMPTELSEYLREETYLGLSLEQTIHSAATVLAAMQEPIKSVYKDVHARSRDLHRLGVGN